MGAAEDDSLEVWSSTLSAATTLVGLWGHSVPTQLVSSEKVISSRKQSCLILLLLSLLLHFTTLALCLPTLGSLTLVSPLFIKEIKLAEYSDMYLIPDN